ncbi:hypothetical protein PybrP1_011778 [[Pythium] brassicae (nom. inval.)]|nr:hypothetical protein PybrP1_011778 [[Pythium] brassicae (nom. inval.)]
MDAPSYAADARKLLGKVAVLTADAQLRALLLRRKCEALERALAFVAAQQTRRLERAQETQAHAQVLHESVEGAIQRARLVRAALATSPGGDSGEGDEDNGDGGEGEGESELQGILAMAKRIRTHTPPLATAGDQAAAAMAPTPSLALVAEARLAYPRRMKALLDQLRDLDEREAHESVRVVFCRRMSERLTARASDDAGSDRSRVHVGYATQAARLQHAYKLLAAFTLEHAGGTSERLQAALNAPTLSSVVPVYVRVQQGKRLLKRLNTETRAFAQRAPLPPAPLSRAATAHRDALLSRLTAASKKTPPHTRAAADAISNAPLAALSSPLLAPHAQALERLQAAWDASWDASCCFPPRAAGGSAFDTALRELVLVDTSNAVLAFFKTIFCDEPDEPEPVRVQHMLLLLRLVDSVALTRGRRLRSVVALE